MEQRITQNLAGQTIHFTLASGDVIDVTQIVETVAPGGRWTTDTLFLRDGAWELSVKIVGNPVPVRLGNRVTLVYGSRRSDWRGTVLGIYNHDTKNAGRPDKLPPPRLPALKILLGMGVAGAIAGWLVPVVLNVAILVALVGFIPFIVYRRWVRARFVREADAYVRDTLRGIAEGKNSAAPSATSTSVKVPTWRAAFTTR